MLCTASYQLLKGDIQRHTECPVERRTLELERGLHTLFKAGVVDSCPVWVGLALGVLGSCVPDPPGRGFFTSTAGTQCQDHSPFVCEDTLLIVQNQSLSPHHHSYLCSIMPVKRKFLQRNVLICVILKTELSCHDIKQIPGSPETEIVGSVSIWHFLLGHFECTQNVCRTGCLCVDHEAVLVALGGVNVGHAVPRAAGVLRERTCLCFLVV